VIEELYEALYEHVKREKETKKEGSRTRLGHDFEEEVTQIVWKHARKSDAQLLPSRHTIDLPTVSGQAHQFDAAFKIGNAYHVFECKRQESPTIDYVYYFNSKILDYMLKTVPGKHAYSFRGTLISHRELGDQTLAYALAYGINICDPGTPPLEVIMATSRDTKLRAAVTHFRKTLPTTENAVLQGHQQNLDAAQLCRMYRFYVRRWLTENEQKKAE